MKEQKPNFNKVVKSGIRSGLKTAGWIARKTILITFIVTILKWSGALNIISQFIEPVLGYIGLSTEGCLVFLTGLLANIYSAIAVMTTLSIDIRMATILAVMALICHNLIIETIIQHKAGSSTLKIMLIRILTAIVSAYALNIILPKHMPGSLLFEAGSVITDPTLGYAIYQWALQMIKMIPTIFIVIVTLNILQMLLRQYDLIKYICKPMKPLMYIFGLHEDCAFLWVILNFLGLAYGGAIMISESEQYPKEHINLLNTHAAITHSLLEDTLVFVAIGLSTFWMIIPRVILCIIVVWAEKFVLYAQCKYHASRLELH